MLSKKHRLAKHAEVAATTAKGRSFFSKSFVVKFLKTPTNDLRKLTVIASAKVSKSAVIRNRLKRVVREEFRKVINKIKPGQYAIIIKRSATQVTSQELAQEVVEAIKNSRIFK
ncbi:MAG TPA: ribonuclease P protein component [Candidatus Doudnabacteria bacterium]|mgnify:CR=1 FL=1|nr:ribonuclease P protein component [Candidatus Doudnabacteria bacterium]